MDLVPAVAASLDRWHDMVARRDMSGLRGIVADDAVFRSPVAHTPYRSADAVVLAVSTVLEVFADFAYHRQWGSADAGRDGAEPDRRHGVVLEFSASVGGKDLRGVDLITFDDDGRIVEFEVMIRPMSALAALGEEMGRRVGPELKAYG